ncbi:MAG: LD-carboxypeptidase [Clostridia bacterium]|nr:LD-carboxypeptidase [Clostridia bacterium]
MIKTVGIVSLSSGLLGEDFVSHSVKIGLERLKNYGLDVKFMPNSRRGIDYLKDHPGERAADLLEAFRDPDIDMILCAIGGDDTYRLLPYLFDNGELADAVCDKIFLGFSDTTINHFMLHKVGLKTFYGQSFISDVCEMTREMLPYTKKYFEELIASGTIKEIMPSDIWYNERESFGPEQMWLDHPSHPDKGFELLQGKPVFSGKILGGCIDSIYDIFNGERYADMPVLCEKYGLFPSADEWRGRIMLLESSEEKMPPAKYKRALEYLKDAGVFKAVSGLLIGKPMDGAYEDEYKEALVEVIGDPSLPIVCNIKIGHALPRCIIPFGVEAAVDAEKQIIRFSEV